MKQKLSDRWFSWMEKDPSHEVGDEGGLVTFKFLGDKILPELNKEGFEVPGRRSLSTALSAGVGPLPEIKMKHGKHLKVMSSFVHLLNMLWWPC